LDSQGTSGGGRAIAYLLAWYGASSYLDKAEMLSSPPLCASVYSTDGLNHGTMNNSSSQAELFFQNFTSTSQFKGLQVNAVTGCEGAEDVSHAHPPQLTTIEMAWKTLSKGA
jgi:hypothetical protein